MAVKGRNGPVQSWEIERWQWREMVASDRGPSHPSTRLVLFVLSLHMNAHGEHAFPSQATIAKRSGLSERSVRTHLGLAEKDGWVKIYQKPRTGQAWFVNEYVATIPSELREYFAEKPWEKDPTWRRPENSAGRSTETEAPEQKSGASPGLDPHGSHQNPLHPATGAEHPAIGAQRAANPSATPGSPFRDARQPLPTNTPDNSPSNTPMNTPYECAVQSDRTTVVKAGFEKEAGKAKPKTKGQPLSREQCIELARIGFAKGLDAETIRKQYGLELTDLE